MSIDVKYAKWITLQKKKVSLTLGCGSKACSKTKGFWQSVVAKSLLLQFRQQMYYAISEKKNRAQIIGLSRNHKIEMLLHPC